MERIRVEYTHEPHVELGLYDCSQEERAEMEKTHEGFLLGWASETRPGDSAKDDMVVVGIIEDSQSHQLCTIPYKRIKIVETN